MRITFGNSGEATPPGRRSINLNAMGPKWQVAKYGVTGSGVAMGLTELVSLTASHPGLAGTLNPVGTTLGSVLGGGLAVGWIGRAIAADSYSYHRREVTQNYGNVLRGIKTVCLVTTVGLGATAAMALGHGMDTVAGGEMIAAAATLGIGVAADLSQLGTPRDLS